jgi:hypothetical protein
MNNDNDELAIPEDTTIVQVEVDAVGAIVRSEVEAQLSAAHRYPRSIKRFLGEAKMMATINRETAEMCIYSLPRGGKNITGPSVRLAEICASAYGNLHIGARVLDAGETDITAQGIAWDLEKNVRVTLETKRRITNKQGRRFDDDMVIVTGNAAASIALRNAIFRVVPKAYVQAIYEAARATAVGEGRTFDDRRAEVVQRLTKLGITQERVLARVNRTALLDVTADDLEVLIGLGTAIKNADVSVDAAFPAPMTAPDPANEGKRMSLGKASQTPAEPQRQPGDD